MKGRGWVLVLGLLVGVPAAAQVAEPGCVDDARSPLEALRPVLTPVNPICRADKFSKTYPGPNGSNGERTWYGRRVVDVQCQYVCESDNLPTVTIKATRTVKFFSETGYELACFAVPYKPIFNARAMDYIYMDQEPQRFFPGKSDVRELISWANGK